MGQDTRDIRQEIGPFANTRKILLFDEDIESLVRNAAPVEAQGFEVHKCASIESAIRSVEREDFDLAIVDQGTPAFEGRRVIRHLVRYNFPMPLIVIARFGNAQCRQQAKALGAIEYLEKPLPATTINGIIQDLLGQSLRK